MTKIVFTGPFTEQSGYSNLNRGFVRNLYNRGYDMGIENIYCPMELTQEEWYEFKKFEKPGIGKEKLYLDLKNVIKIISWLPLNDMPRFKKNLLYTMAETKDLSPVWMRVIDSYYDEVIVPSQYYADRFVEHGITKPIHVVPIGLDESFSKENIVKDFDLKYELFSKPKAPEKPEGFRFVSVFRWSYRKGIDVLIKAFLREFSYDDNVSLVLIARHAASSLEQRFFDAVREQLKKLVDENSNLYSPPIYLNCEIIEQKYMPTVYANNNCFITCSRGEGQCLPPLEASLMGLPCIAPRHTGFSDFVTKDTAFSFEVDKWEVCDNNEQWKEWTTPSYAGQEFPVFGKKVIKEVGELMREAMNNPKACQEKNKNMMGIIEKNYTWKTCTDRMENVLKRLI